MSSSNNLRYSKRLMPEYPHRPGLTIHPNKPGGHSYEQEERIAAPITDFRAHQDYLWGIDCLNHGYFWEAHTAFEAIWNAHHRKGAIADIMKALIKMAAAALKLEAYSSEAARGHLERALELIQPLSEDGFEMLGLDKKILVDWLEETLAPKELKIKLSLALIF